MSAAAPARQVTHEVNNDAGPQVFHISAMSKLYASLDYLRCGALLLLHPLPGVRSARRSRQSSWPDRLRCGKGRWRRRGPAAQLSCSQAMVCGHRPAARGSGYAGACGPAALGNPLSRIEPHRTGDVHAAVRGMDRLVGLLSGEALGRLELARSNSRGLACLMCCGPSPPSRPSLLSPPISQCAPIDALTQSPYGTVELQESRYMPGRCRPSAPARQ